MLTKEELLKLLRDVESSRVERTVSTADTDKFCEAVCAFANDMPDSKQNGFLLVGAFDDGTLSGLKATDSLLKNIAAIRSDGNVLPIPAMNVEVFHLDGGDIVSVEVSPSVLPPVRYRGRTWIRVGPRKAIATREEEDLLIERRRAKFPTFDSMPCVLAKLEDLDLDYRNPIIADAMRTLGYVNRFGRGIGRVKAELIDNGNGEPSFDTAQIGSFRVSVGLTKYAMEAGGATLPTERLQESGVKSTESSQRLAEGEESRNESKECTSKSEGGTGESVPAPSESVPRGAESVPRGLESVPSGLECSPSREQIAAWAHAVLPAGIRSDGLKNMISVLTVVGLNKFATTESIASEVGVTQRGIKKITAALQKLGVLKHEGPSFGGYWELVGFES